MNINIVYDASVSKAPAGFLTAMTAAVNYLDGVFTNNVTINIAAGWGEVNGQLLSSGSLGQSVVTTYQAVAYSAVAAALRAEGAPGSANLPATSPFAGDLIMDSAQAKALNLAPASSAIDGYVGFSSALPFSFLEGVAPAANQYYLIGVIEHELTEVMGRFALVSGQPTYYTLADMFRYAAPGVRNLASGGSGSTAYFSVDSGATNLGLWNNDPNNGDLADWYPNGPAAGGADAFNDYTSSGKLTTVSAADVTLMRALGWTSGPAVGALVVKSIAENPATGLQAAGAKLLITVTLSGAATVTGAPTLSLNDGATATYVSGSASSVLTFAYTVGAADSVVPSLSVNAINLNGGTIKDSSGSALDPTIAGLAQSGPAIDPRGLAVNALNVSAYQNRYVSAAAMIASVTNPYGDSITKFRFMDSGASGGALYLNGVAQAAGQWIEVAASALTGLQYLAGAAPGAETLQVAAFDATTGVWSNASGLTAATLAPVDIVNTAAWVAANLDALQTGFVAGSLGSITLTDAVTPKLSITATQLTSDAGALGNIVSAFTIAASGTLGSAAAAGVSASLAAKLTAGLAVVDSAANVAANLAGLKPLVTAAKLASITLTDAVAPTLSLAATLVAANATVLAKIVSAYQITPTGVIGAAAAVGVPATLRTKLTTGFAVSDTAANVSTRIAGLQTIAAAAKLASIALTDPGTPVIAITATQLAADVTSLLTVTTPFAISASGTVTAAGAAKVPTTLAARLTAGLAIADSAANVTLKIAAMQTLAAGGHLASITLTDVGTPTLSLTAAQLKADVTAIADIVTPYAVSSTGLSAAFNGDSVRNFAVPGSMLDITDLNPATLTAMFTENATGTAGTLTLADGVHAANITLFGQYMSAGYSGAAASAGFVAMSDGGMGTRLTYSPPLAAPHGGPNGSGGGGQALVIQ